MLPPLLSVVAHGNHDTKCARIHTHMHARAFVYYYTLLVYFQIMLCLDFSICFVFRMLVVRTQQIKQNLAQYGLFKT